MLRSITRLKQPYQITHFLLLIHYYAHGSILHLHLHQHSRLLDNTSNQFRGLIQLQYKPIEKLCFFFSDDSIKLALLLKQTYIKAWSSCGGVRYCCFR